MTEVFINRPVATILLTIGLFISGVIGFYFLPAAPLPQVEFPIILVQAAMPGASPEIMASSIVTPIEKKLTRISGVVDISSTSTLGNAKIIVQFDLSKDINESAREVQAALNAASSDLPSNMPSKPYYKLINPADSPIIVLGLMSKTLGVDKVFDFASTHMQQKLMQIEGVGQVTIGGSALPSIRIEVDIIKLHASQLTLEDVANKIRVLNQNTPKGRFELDDRSFEITTNDELFSKEDYENLILTNIDGKILKIKDVATVVNSVQDIRASALVNGEKGVGAIIFRQPGANVVTTVEKIKKAMPGIQATIPADIQLSVLVDRTLTIKGALHDVERTLVISTILVIFVVFWFLRDINATIIPTVSMIASLFITFGAMKLLGYSLNNLSLMAITIATGFVVDDAIVVLENIILHMEKNNLSAKEAAIVGSKEICFTVVSISFALIAVFIPILFMGGIVGRLFKEFSVTLAVAILVSLVLSLTLTPMLSSKMLHHNKAELSPSFIKSIYEKTLKITLEHEKLMAFASVIITIFSVILFAKTNKGFFPQQDTGRIQGMIITDQNLSFRSLESKLTDFIKIVKEDSAIENAIGIVGLSTSNTSSGSIFISLKDSKQRDATADEVIERLRPKLAKIPGATVYLQSSQDLVIGGKQTNAQYQYGIFADTLQDVNFYTPKIMNMLSTIDGIVDINSDQRSGGLRLFVQINKTKAAMLNVTNEAIDNLLYYSYGQSPVSTMYTSLNQYYVVLEASSEFWSNPKSLDIIKVKSTNGNLVPLSEVAEFKKDTTLLSVNHQNLMPSATISFNLKPNISLGDVVNKINAKMAKEPLPSSLQKKFMGTAEAFKSSASNQKILLLTAIVSVYIVLGILYESLLHPITILSTLPPASFGALLSLIITKTDLTVISIIGLILLIGIVMKNAIMMIDCVIEIQKHENLNPKDAIYKAAILRFRPIMMTTMCALFSAIPLIVDEGGGAEMRRPLGVTIIGGLIVSQILTLYITPSVYLLMEKFNNQNRS